MKVNEPDSHGCVFTKPANFHLKCYEEEDTITYVKMFDVNNVFNYFIFY